MDIYLIRHTKTTATSGLCYGQSDIPLADNFQDDAELLQQKLPVRAANHLVFSSPLIRCIALAETLSGQIKADDRLLELNFGDWENKHFADIDQKKLKYWADNVVDVAPPNGESFEDLIQRASYFWDEILILPLDQVFIVTHAGVIRALLAHILSLPKINAFQFAVNLGSTHKMQYQNDYIYVGYINK